MNISERKRSLRLKLRRELKLLEKSWLKEAEKQLGGELKKLLLRLQVESTEPILTISPHFEAEPDLSTLAPEFALYCARCTEEQSLDFYKFPCPLIPGVFGLPEPDPLRSEALMLEKYSRIVCLIPGLAFDRQGGRLGRGKGYYDRFLGFAATKTKVVKIGVGWSSQIAEELPMDVHDQRVQFICTEEKVLEVDSL